MVGTKVGFAGLGAMGGALVLNALNAGFDLTVFDLREAATSESRSKGAHVAVSPRDLGESSDIIQLAVPDDLAVRAVVLGDDGILAGARRGSTILIHSTIHPKTATQLGEAAAARGVHVLDAQMTGGRAGAVDRTLLFMVGGD